MNRPFVKDKINPFFPLIGFLLLVFFSFPSKVIPSEKNLPLTNENFLRKTINTVLENYLKDAPFTTESIWIKQEDENPFSWIVEEEIISYLQERGPVGIGGDSMVTEKDLILSFRVIELNLEYPEVKRKGFLGKGWVVREAQVFLSFKLSNHRGEVLWSKKGGKRNSDLIEMGQLTELNNQLYSLLSPEVPESSWSKYVEPAVVTVVVGALVYLFFANR